MKKLLCAVLLLSALAVMGCASTQNAQLCDEVSIIMVKMPECATGWGTLGITGHGPSCADNTMMSEIRAICPGYE